MTVVKEAFKKAEKVLQSDLNTFKELIYNNFDSTNRDNTETDKKCEIYILLKTNDVLLSLTDTFIWKEPELKNVIDFFCKENTEKAKELITTIDLFKIFRSFNSTNYIKDIIDLQHYGEETYTLYFLDKFIIRMIEAMLINIINPIEKDLIKIIKENNYE